MTTDKKSEVTTASNQTKWWQWFLLYPAVAVSVLSAIPTYIELYQSQTKNVAFGESKDALFRNEMFRKNLTCTTAPFDPLVTPANVQVDATICKSGDVLVRVMPPESKHFFEWVSVDRFFPPQSSSISFFSEAMASNSEMTIQLAQSSPIVLCQNWLDDVMLKRRISVTGRGCFDEVINTYTGYVVSTTPAPCTC